MEEGKMSSVTLAGSAFLIAFGLISAVFAEDALNGEYSADSITFERWCSEIQAYTPERCAKRDPADLDAFAAARERIGQVEIEHAKEQRKNREFRETLDAHDRLDRNQRFDF